MGDMTEYYLANSLQSEDNGIHISIPPKNYYPDDSGAHTVNILNNKKNPSYMMAFYPISMFGYQELKKLTPISVSPLHHGTVGDYSCQELFLNALDKICLVLSVQLN